MNDPFPGSRPLTAAELEGCEPGLERPGWAFAGLGPRIEWRRCECPWWHRLPFAGRFVHSELP